MALNKTKKFFKLQRDFMDTMHFFHSANSLKAAAHRARCDAPRPLRSRLRQLLRLPMHTAAIFLRKNRATRAMRFQRPIALTTHTQCD